MTSVLLVALPGFFHLTWTNTFVKTALLQGWIPLVLAMLLSSGSGMLLGAFHERYAAMAVLVPVMNSACRQARLRLLRSARADRRQCA